MKWPMLSSQRKSYAVVAFLLVVVVMLAIDQIALWRETSGLKRAIGITNAIARSDPSAASSLERKIDDLRSQVASVRLDMDNLASSVRGTKSHLETVQSDDLVRRINRLEFSVSDFDQRITSLERSARLH